MTRTEHLLVILSEECAEVSKEVSKCLRFGLDDKEPGQELSNREKVIKELSDLNGVMEMLQNDKVLSLMKTYDILEKKKKVERYLEYSEFIGTLI